MTAPLLTARQVGELLGVSPETILRWTRGGLVPAIRLPSGAIRYRTAELDEWLEARVTARRGPAAAAAAGDTIIRDNVGGPAVLDTPRPRATEVEAP